MISGKKQQSFRRKQRRLKKKLEDLAAQKQITDKEKQRATARQKKVEKQLKKVLDDHQKEITVLQQKNRFVSMNRFRLNRLVRL